VIVKSNGARAKNMACRDFVLEVSLRSRVASWAPAEQITCCLVRVPVLTTNQIELIPNTSETYSREVADICRSS
jgi:hypothetical protein